MQRCNKDKNGGGCLIYYGEHLDITVKDGIDKRSTESVWMDLLIDSQHYLFTGIYRPPNRADFYDKLKDILDKIWIKRKSIALLGDFNSDLLFRGKLPKQIYYEKRLLKVRNQFSLQNIIKTPTRIQDNTKTIIDLIIVSNVDKILRSGTFEPAVSDHKLFYAVINLRRSNPRQTIKTVRDYKSLNLEELNRTSEQTPR